MKSTLIILALLVVSANLVAQQQSRELYQSKIATYTKMKRAGGILTGVGVGLTVVGISVLSNLDYYNTTNSYGQPTSKPSDPGKFAWGVASVVGGIGMMGAGIPLSIIGSIKTKKYSKKLQNVSLKMNLVPNRHSVTLAYRF